MKKIELVHLLNDRETPVYFYDMDLLAETLESATTAASRYGYHLHYAVKANHNRKILQTINRQGLGAD